MWHWDGGCSAFYTIENKQYIYILASGAVWVNGEMVGHHKWAREMCDNLQKSAKERNRNYALSSVGVDRIE